jgi:hypothetical protein
MLTGISDTTAYPTLSKYTYGEIIEKVFGSEKEPTAGTFYYISDSEIEKTITEEIYGQLAPTSLSMKDLTIVDYFPQTIVDNFDFAYVASANLGEVSPTIDTTTNSITWKIGELASGETGYVQYTLTLKDNYNSNIVGVILDTNEKVDIAYTDFDGVTGTKTSDVTPKVRVTEPAEVLPDTGTPLLFIVTLFAAGLGLFTGFKFYNITRKTK